MYARAIPDALAATGTVLLVVLPAACSSNGARDSAEVTRSIYENDGTVCVSATTEGLWEAIVYPETCLSSSCDTVVESDCSLALDAGRIVVESRFVIERQGEECTADCGQVSKHCQLAGVAAGQYEVIHGEDQASVTSPAAGEELFDDGSHRCGYLP